MCIRTRGCTTSDTEDQNKIPMNLKSSFMFAMVAAFGSSANAAIVVSSTTTSAVAGGTQYQYVFTLQADQNMRQTCSGVCALTNDYVVLYDFAGYIAASASVTSLLAGRTFTLNVENTSTQPPNQAVTDNATLANFRVSLTGGGDVLGSGTGVDLFRLTATSSLLPGSNNLFYSAQAQNKALTTTAGNTNFASGPTTNPTPPGVPEPSTFALLGTGVAMLLYRRSR